MNVLLQRLIRNWECSGQGDGGIDVINDGDELVDHEFGQLTNRSRGALHTRAAFLGTNQPYLLYFWEMLNKYQLLSTSFSELSSKMSSKNGGDGFPSVVNNNRIDDEDNSFYCGTGDCSDTGSSSILTLRKGKSSSKKKSRLTTPSRDFSGSLDRLAQSYIVASKMDVSLSLDTNILLLEAEYRTLDMALVDDPHPKKKTKIEEQMSTVESKIQQLKSDLNNLIATPP